MVIDMMKFLMKTVRPGNDFLATLCNDWEKEAEKVEQSWSKKS